MSESHDSLPISSLADALGVSMLKTHRLLVSANVRIFERSDRYEVNDLIRYLEGEVFESTKLRSEDRGFFEYLKKAKPSYCRKCADGVTPACHKCKENKDLFERMRGMLVKYLSDDGHRWADEEPPRED